MHQKPEDLPGFNPYEPPAAIHADSDDTTSNSNIVIWKWVATVVAIEIGMTAVFMAIHSFSPHVFVITSGVVSLFVTGALTVGWSWKISARRPAQGTIVVVQATNVLIWLIYTVMVHLCHGINWSREGRIPLIFFAISAGLCLVASLVAVRSRPVA
jgi:hypothetical protein